jgi:multidrug resistance efflux pump
VTIVRFDPPSLRKHDRTTAPASVIFDHVRYATLQWSPGGFSIQGYSGTAQLGERALVRFMLNFHGFEVGFNATVEVCRVDPATETLAARYVDLGEREQELLKHFLAGFVSGQIGAIGDTIRHIDIPLRSLPAPAPTAEPRGRWQRASALAGRSLLYLILGPIVLGFAGLAVYRTFFQLEIQTAVVTRPIEPLVSLGTGRISDFDVREGQAVAPNQVLFVVEDEQIRREVDEARFDRDAAAADLEAAHSASHSGDERIGVYQSIARDKQVEAAEQVGALTEQCEAAKNHLQRVQAVVDGGYESPALLDQAKSGYAQLNGALKEAKAELAIANDGVRAAAKGSFYDGFRLVEEGPQLYGAEAAARARARVAEQRYQAAESRAALLTCRAPFTGSVVRILKSPGSAVGRGEEIAFIEHLLEPPRVQALLSQDEAGQVRVGARVTVQIPALGRSFAAAVERVDRANLLANPLLTNPALRPAWGPVVDRTAWMSVTLLHLTPADNAALRSGMPAAVTMGRAQWSTPWNQMVASLRGAAR